MAPRVVLIGPPGAGKSSVGRALAQRWGLRFRDTDTDVENAAGISVSELFVTEGEPAFRERERAAVRAALAEHDGVLALGGGAVMTPEVADALTGQPVVFLDVGLADASTRVGLGVARPLLLGNVRGQLKRQLEARRPTYLRLARLVVDTNGRTVEQVADAVARGLAADAAAADPSGLSGE